MGQKRTQQLHARISIRLSGHWVGHNVDSGCLNHA